MLLLSATSAMAQESDNTHVSVKCGETPLESLLTDGQKKAVTHLTVTGVLLDEDYKYLREKLFGQLKELNMRDADIDTIPEGAFSKKYDINYNVVNVNLPSSLVHLSDCSLASSGTIHATFFITGRYPSVGRNVNRISWDEGRSYLYASEDNEYIEYYNSCLYSVGKDTLYRYCDEGFNEIYSTTKVISGKAFEYCFSGSDLVLPETIDSIGDYAFANFEFIITTGIHDKDPLFKCFAETPPKMGKDVFKGFCSHVYGLNVFVPDESVELYKNAPGWENMNVQPLTSGIETTENDDDLQCEYKNGALCFKSVYNINQIQIYNLQGQLTTTICPNDKECTISRSERHISASIAVVRFNNNKKRTLKINNI